MSEHSAAPNPRPPSGRPPDGAAPATGHPRVDSALAELDRIVELLPAAQVSGYTQVQHELQAALAELAEER